MSRARKHRREMNGNSLGVVLSSGGSGGGERSEGSRSEPEWSGAAAEAGAGPTSASHPDPEVVAKAKRRTFTAEYKQRILQEADSAAATPGGVGALPPPRGFVFLALGELATRTSSRRPRGPETAQTRSAIRAQSPGGRKPEVAPAGGPIDGKTPQSGNHHRRAKKSGCAVGEPHSRLGPRGEILRSAVSELAIDVGTNAACQALRMPRAS